MRHLFEAGASVIKANNFRPLRIGLALALGATSIYWAGRYSIRNTTETPIIAPSRLAGSLPKSEAVSVWVPSVSSTEFPVRPVPTRVSMQAIGTPEIGLK